MKKIFKILLIIFLFLIYIFISLKSYATNVNNDLSNYFFRLHILANSDSNEDQELKLKVRDEIIKFINSKNLSSKTAAQNYIKNNINSIKKIAEKTINENGYNYYVNIKIGNYYFPTKYYEDLTLPAGFYDCIKIEIGSASGHNWWCSLYPPLCFNENNNGKITSTDLENLKNNLTEDEYNLITNSNKTDIKIKFKIVEKFNEIFL